MNFSDVKSAADRLRNLLNATAGKEVIAVVSLSEPNGSNQELDFHKLVLWSYGILLEAGHPAIKYLLGLLRASDPKRASELFRTRENVINLRTVQSHNLTESPKDQHKKRQTEIWKLQNGEHPTDFQHFRESLCSELVGFFNALADRWKEVIQTEEDRRIALSELDRLLTNSWPPHSFDSFIVEAARSIGLAGLDAKSYRESRAPAWIDMIAYFDTRESAIQALRRIIAAELAQRYGVKGIP